MIRTNPVQAFLALFCLAACMAGPEVSGPARVIDGDSLVVGGVELRLQGLDAPEWNAPGGPAALRGMRGIVAGQRLTCALTGERTYDRAVAVCRLPDGRDVAAELVRAGLALDCAHFSGGRYRALETPGLALKIGRRPYCNR